MDREQALSFLATHHRTTLATKRSNGRLQLSPVVATVDDGGHIVISTRSGSAKARNLARDPWATLCVVTDNFYGPWIQVEGPCEIIRLPQAMDGLIAYYRSISGEHENWDEYRAAMVSEERVLLRIDVDKAGPSLTR